ncbi:MAG: hypothetical protein EXX96DRAFT_488033, partial [Benjaminiella poitrasii]
YSGTEAEAMELVYEYGEITTHIKFDVPVYDIQMKDTDRNFRRIKYSYYFRR